MLSIFEHPYACLSNYLEWLLCLNSSSKTMRMRNSIYSAYRHHETISRPNSALSPNKELHNRPNLHFFRPTLDEQLPSLSFLSLYIITLPPTNIISSAPLTPLTSSPSTNDFPAGISRVGFCEDFSSILTASWMLSSFFSLNIHSCSAGRCANSHHILYQT